jgi:hypothetical protein
MKKCEFYLSIVARHSISTFAPNARPFAPMVLRAGEVIGVWLGMEMLTKFYLWERSLFYDTNSHCIMQ